MRRALLALLSPVVLMALASSASASLIRVSDTGSVWFDTSWCTFVGNCYYDRSGSSDSDLQATDEIQHSLYDGWLSLTTSFEPDRIHTAFDAASFTFTASGPPCADCYWDFGASDTYAYRVTVFQVSEPTLVRIFGVAFPGDIIEVTGSSGGVHGPLMDNFDETALLAPGQYTLSAFLGPWDSQRVTLEVIPEPSTGLLLALGLGGLAARRSVGAQRALVATKLTARAGTTADRWCHRGAGGASSEPAGGAPATPG